MTCLKQQTISKKTYYLCPTTCFHFGSHMYSSSGCLWIAAISPRCLGSASSSAVYGAFPHCFPRTNRQHQKICIFPGQSKIKTRKSMIIENIVLNLWYNRINIIYLQLKNISLPCYLFFSQVACSLTSAPKVVLRVRIPRKCALLLQRALLNQTNLGTTTTQCASHTVYIHPN